MEKLRVTVEVRDGVLAGCSLFVGVEPPDRRRLAALGSLRRYAAGETLFRQDVQASGFFVVASGLVEVARSGPDGRRQVLHLFGPGEVVGEVAAFQGSGFPAGAVARRRSRVLFLPRDEVLALGRDRPEVLLALLGTLAGRLRRLVGLIEDLALKSVPSRLAARLLTLAAEQGRPAGPVELPTAKSVLAAALGTSPETLSRALRRLHEQGVLDVDGRRITLRDPGHLRRLAAGTEP